jgi:hypothetical protein
VQEFQKESRIEPALFLGSVAAGRFRRRLFGHRTFTRRSRSIIFAQTQLSLDKFDLMQHRSPFVRCLGADGVGAEGVGSDGVDVQMESV